MRFRLRGRRACLTLTAALAVFSLGSGAAPTSALPAPPQGWRVAWADDFTGRAGSLPDASRWIIDQGTQYPGGPPHWGTGEVQTYTDDPANLRLDGQGRLRITPLRDRAGRWTSGRIETRRSDFQPPDGGKQRIEARIQLPSVTGSAAEGYWAAFWTLGASYRQGIPVPEAGEFDIMENANGLNRIWGALHCGTPGGKPCNEDTGVAADTACTTSPCTGNFHKYTLEWDRSSPTEYLRWYVDGRLFHTVSSTQLDPAAWKAATGHGHFILLNLAIGGSFPDALAGHHTPTARTRPGSPMLVDFVTVLTTAPR
ncbi:glycoside hydrolase family 16 protein [Streptomyces massasporeus]|uniref:glycoside hydrolase family 16 protein n=1 Tax=Streptomyces massasporeus TaxID=67324 RepID=UPI0033C620C1